LLRIAQFCHQHTGRDRPNAGDLEKPLAAIVLAQLLAQLTFNLADLLVQILEMCLQPFKQRHKPGRQLVLGQRCRQAPDDCLTARQADAELQ